MIKGNRGEWSELYAFIKLLADGRLFAADENLKKIDNQYYAIVKIIRGFSNKTEYHRGKEILVTDSNGNIITRISIDDSRYFADLFLDGIKNSVQGKGSFGLSFAEKAMSVFQLEQISDDRKETADIRIVIHDPVTQFEPLLGFSIKSYLGNKPTLFNAGKPSNILFQISPDLDDAQYTFLNSMENYGERIRWLDRNGFKFRFSKIMNEYFKSNLELVDSRMPEIMGNIILDSHLGGSKKLKDLTERLSAKNPCNFNMDLNPNFYYYKIKRFLVDCALGMKAGSLWTGNYSANGGYIAIKDDGELVCYHIYNWNSFQNYLIQNTKIDFPDSSPNRCDYGRILKFYEVDENQGCYIKLNFQVRFS